MIVIGSNSDVATAFVEKVLKEGKRFPLVYLFTSNVEKTAKLAQHIFAKYEQKCEIVDFDLTKDNDYSRLNHIDSELLFCAAGYLGKNSEEGLYDDWNTKQTVEINYSKLIVLINHFAKKFEAKGSGTIIGLSSVAGERGRQSNFIYGSAKAGFTAYLAGLRNYLFHEKVHVMTVIPGFMDTQMTADIETPKPLTAQPDQAADIIYKAYLKKRNVVYVTFVWWGIMMIIRNVPEFIFKKMKM
ncbi:3-oxoacyl-[acyl-carrier-protein] reductase FabG [Algoriella xinjiangensis]|uniref:SDR family NAD(P)-dependent oxidoreductase n=1 Tax=Algoriella xinjiangensis TaxID=684065 RepID=UPI000F6400EB|nr:SDR family NAD(P)-dependent oxidoreductase [Algoriella xinjiangensis]VDH17168.1 3-oxoacyl-[acyl-carrier-protein] reductase FabG [Algoriella xinjiangensis]